MCQVKVASSVWQPGDDDGNDSDDDLSMPPGQLKQKQAATRGARLRPLKPAHVYSQPVAPLNGMAVCSNCSVHQQHLAGVFAIFLLLCMGCWLVHWQHYGHAARRVIPQLLHFLVRALQVVFFADEVQFPQMWFALRLHTESHMANRQPLLLLQAGDHMLAASVIRAERPSKAVCQCRHEILIMATFD